MGSFHGARVYGDFAHHGARVQLDHVVSPDRYRDAVQTHYGARYARDAAMAHHGA